MGGIALSTLNTGNNLLILVLSLLLSALMVSGVVSNLVLHALKVPDRIHAQSLANFQVTVQNVKRKLPSFALRLRGVSGGNGTSESTDFFSRERHFSYLGAGETVSLPLQSRFERRGVYPVDAFEIRTTSPFGFVDRGKRLEARGRIVVYPALRELGPLLERMPFLRQGRARRTRGGTQLHKYPPLPGRRQRSAGPLEIDRQDSPSNDQGLHGGKRSVLRGLFFHLSTGSLRDLGGTV